VSSAFLCLSRGLFTYDILFTELLNEEYLVALSSKNLLLFLQKNTFELVSRLSFGAFPLSLPGMLFSLLFSHPLSRNFLDLVLL